MKSIRIYSENNKQTLEDEVNKALNTYSQCGFKDEDIEIKYSSNTYVNADGDTYTLYSALIILLHKEEK